MLVGLAPLANLILVGLILSQRADGGGLDALCLILFVYLLAAPLILLGARSIWNMGSLPMAFVGCGVAMLLPLWMPGALMAMFAFIVLCLPWFQLAFSDPI